MSKSKPQVDTKQVSIPAWLESASQGNINYASALPDSVPYTGQGVAGLTPDQLRAFQLANGNVGTGQGIMQPAIGGATNAMNFAAPMLSGASVGQDVQGLLSPYMSQVIDASNNEIERNRILAQQQNDANAARMHAWGGDRAGVVDAENTRNFADLKAKTTANLLQGGWQDAVQRAIQMGQGNQNAAVSGAGVNLAGSNALAGFGNMFQNLGANDVQGLLQTGGIQQQNAQAGNTFDYNEFLRRLNDPYKKLAAMTQATGAAKTGSTQTNTSTVTSNPLASIAGIGLGLGSLAMGNPMGIMSAMSGVSGLLGGGSSGGGGFFGGSPETNPNLNPATYGNLFGASY